MPIHLRRIGDTLIPLSAQLLRRVGREQVPVDLTDLTVKFKMLDGDGNEIIALTDAEIIEETEGTVSYTFDDYDVAGPGDFYGYFVVTDGTKTDHFPVTPKNLLIRITEDVPEGED